MNARSRSPIVWVVEQAPFDYSPAKVYGDVIRLITADPLTPNAADASWHHRTISQVRKALADYIPGLDFVIPTGSPVRMMLVGLLLKERGDVHKLLGWDARSQRYLEYTFDLRLVSSAPNAHRGAPLV